MVLVLILAGGADTFIKAAFIIQSTIPTLVIFILAAEAKGDAILGDECGDDDNHCFT